MSDQELDPEVGRIRDMFADEDTVVEEFFTPRRRTGKPLTEGATPAKDKPTHYKVVSVSLYTEDQDRLATLVAELKRRGYSRANKSLVIREALRQIDLDLVPPQR